MNVFTGENFPIYGILYAVLGCSLLLFLSSVAGGDEPQAMHLAPPPCAQTLSTCLTSCGELFCAYTCTCIGVLMVGK